MAEKVRNFEVSTDSCVDHFKSYLEKNDVHYIVMRYVVDGKEKTEIFDSEEEFDKFYEELKKGVLPTTTQLNPFELKAHFEAILAKTKGDIIHIPLSSGLSSTCANAIQAAEELNKELQAKGDERRVYVVDSLVATIGMAHLVDRLIEFRDDGMPTKDAVAKTEYIRDNQQGWVVVQDLLHLKRGGRISGFKATLGTMLKLRPIIHLSKKGKLAIENKVQGDIKVMRYMLDIMYKYGEKYNKNFANSTMYYTRTSKSDLYVKLEQEIRKTYPNIKIKHVIVGPIIGIHLGCGGVGMVFEGAPRLDIE